MKKAQKPVIVVKFDAPVQENAVECLSLAELKEWCTRNENVYAFDDCGSTLFHELFLNWSAISPQNVKYLLGQGYDMNAPNIWGTTPFHIACLKCNLKTIKYMVKNGANLTATTCYGETALHFAVYGNPNLDVIEYLIREKPENVLVEDKWGFTATDYAGVWGDDARSKAIIVAAGLLDVYADCF